MRGNQYCRSRHFLLMCARLISRPPSAGRHWTLTLYTSITLNTAYTEYISFRNGQDWVCLWRSTCYSWTWQEKVYYWCKSISFSETSIHHFCGKTHKTVKLSSDEAIVSQRGSLFSRWFIALYQECPPFPYPSIRRWLKISSLIYYYMSGTCRVFSKYNCKY